MISSEQDSKKKVQIDSNEYKVEEIELRDIFKAILHGRWIIISVTTVCTLVSALYALSLPNIYKSEVVLAPVAESAGMKIPGQLGGLAALAGVNLGSGSNDKSGLALEIIKSHEFIGRFIKKYDLFIPVMAAEGWSRETDSLKIDNDIYDEKNGKWVRDVKSPFVPKPSLLETHEEFENLFSISQDKATGIVRLSVQHYSPYLAQKWATLLVFEINEEMRRRELTEANDSIAYLNEQINKTSIADLRTMLFSLIEEQTKTVMLANVREEYTFKTVDPAVVAEKKTKPARVLIVILAAMIASVLSSFIVLTRHFSKKSRM